MPSVVVAPGESIRDALTAAGPGGTVTVQPGTYDYLEIAATDAGSSGSPTTIQSSTKWGAKIIPPTGRDGIKLLDGADWIVIDGFEVSGSDNYGIYNVSGDNYVVKNCCVHHNAKSGIDCGSGSTGGIIESCLTEYNGTTAQDHGIYPAHGSCTIRNNVSRFNVGAGLHVYYGTSGVSNATVYGNISYGNGTSPIVYKGPGAGACGTVINNNTLLVPSTSAQPAIYIETANGAVIANNIIYQGSWNESVMHEIGAVVNTVWSNNALYLYGVAESTHSSTDQSTNLLANPGFEDGGGYLTGWTKAEGGTTVISDGTTDADAGSHCVKIAVAAENSSGAIRQAGVTTVGCVYLLTFRAKATSAVGAGLRLTSPDVYCDITTAYKTYYIPFVATQTYLDISKTGATGNISNNLFIDTVSLTRLLGPGMHSATTGHVFLKPASRSIAAGNNTYKPAADFWGQTPPTDVQIGAIPYTEHLHPRTMLNDPWNLTKVRRRWWNWRRREQRLIPG